MTNETDLARALHRFAGMKDAQDTRIRLFGSAVAYATSASAVASHAQDVRTIEVEQARIEAFADALHFFGVDASSRIDPGTKIDQLERDALKHSMR